VAAPGPAGLDPVAESSAVDPSTDHVNVDFAYTTFGGVRLVVGTDELRAARAAVG
jgi:hypothetical protein